MKLKFGINTGFAINRFVEPDDWVSIVADELGLNMVQFTADLLNPWYPDYIVKKGVEKIRNECDKRGVEIETTFTSQFTRVNHLLHPNDEIRKIWIEWFKKFFEMSVTLGAIGAGSHFGIMTIRDWENAQIRRLRLEKGIEGWQELSEYGHEIGLKFLLWEPMSVGREIGETITSTMFIQSNCAEGFAIPMKICYDVDHGDITSENPDDTNPEVWIKIFNRDIRVIHLKQSLLDKGGHYPFTKEYNERGKIKPEKILSVIKESQYEELSLVLEISHRERNPYDKMVIQDLKNSVEFWRPHIQSFAS
ncbi:MAG: sugar phosphate isomerase/epimerase [Candidatus Hydrogenedentes bacterium]|nr:sugar phosphate isomerase/epimerase [Candidatus Hydrogenedentota bacterium]